MDLTSWFTYHRVNEPVAKAELTFDQQNYLIGAAVISEQADELIDDLTLVINQKLTKKSWIAISWGIRHWQVISPIY